MFNHLMQKFIKFIDPKLDKYRPAKPPTPKYTPKTLEDFIGVMQRTPKSILNSSDRNRIAAIMSFEDRHVSDLMTPKKDMIFVSDKEILGPLVLDKLYQSGLTIFPVVDSREKIKGVIRTDALNALEIKKTDRAEKYLDKNVHYLHASDSLSFAVEEIKNTSSYHFFVLDDSESIVGFFTIQMLLDYLLA